MLPNLANINVTQEGFGSVELLSVSKEQLAFHPKSCNRDLMKKLSNKSYLPMTPRWFTYYEKLNTSQMFLTDSTAVSPFVLLLLASNITFETHPDPSSDENIDNETKRKLRVQFSNDEGQVINFVELNPDNLFQLKSAAP